LLLAGASTLFTLSCHCILLCRRCIHFTSRVSRKDAAVFGTLRSVTIVNGPFSPEFQPLNGYDRLNYSQDEPLGDVSSHLSS
jgi:hypothetical protein